MCKFLTYQEKIVCKRRMRLPLTMYLIIFVSASVVFYQYHLSKAWVISHNNSQQFRDLSANPVEKGNNYTYYASKNVGQAVSCNDFSVSNPEIPPLYIITPTYRRPEQLAELTRLAHTIMLTPNVHWLVIEDAEQKTELVTDLLERTGLSYDHLLAPMPEIYKKKKKGPKPRGVSNRNRGLAWIRENAKDGVFYFADDDNTYDLQLFREIRYTKQVSMFPVGLITKLGVSSPIVRNGKFTGFYDGWMAGRKFPVDMAGFAVSVKFLLERPKAEMPFKPGYEEDGFLKSLNPFEPYEIELMADNCTKILVWHTQAKRNEPSQPLDFAKYNNTNLVLLKHILV
ncbi:galactosylgalactosylxylosylprotein 3-beta-glucuronosyltransferase P isoform X2 [Coccinella septempunctata]|uniref:galactosylgalactosylxylosylprotein 3-beta-glucuronosyltransferase P isoform X2 n=1 Tax=Coccinella septempunctata TaxID=41139 RepID=UPI001D0939BF|nr:galactosylgalactosylxylosylprotein 3-beta-glucuronosyltransferase P isoform X2 [Coccinella septempunctata]